jgi:cytochrome c-type biogenesis protein CcmF
LPRADWGKAVAHGGLGVTFIGVALLTAWQTEDIRVARVGETFTVAGYDITLADVQDVEGPNYISTTAVMEVSRNGRAVATLHPEKRVYPVQAMPTTEAAIDNGFFRDIYLVIGDAQRDGGWAVRSYVKPFANWIWAGSILMALGGLISLTDRRYRVAAGARRVMAKAVPAE